MEEKEIEQFCPKNQKDWRNWLKKNHQKQESVWLVYYKKHTGKATLSWSEAVDEALCFGWIDGKARPIDGEKFMHLFSKRKPKGTWSKINKGKIERLIAEKRISKAGLETIARAKENGSWSLLDEVEELIIPKDLAAAFRKQPGSKAYFMSLSKSVKKLILHWVHFAKRPETRAKRILEVVEAAAEKQRPKPFRS